MPKQRYAKKSVRRRFAGLPQAYWYRFKTNYHKWWNNKLWHRAMVGLCLLIALVLGGMYSIAQWYIYRHNDQPLQVGTTFIPDYARRLGVDPMETMDAIIYDLGVRNLRLVSYWDDIEAQQGNYDFSELDWQFEKAQAAGVRLSLAIGLRQPRWPECHMPDWATQMPKTQWQPELRRFITAVVERYRNHPSLDSWQLENEYFLKVFGICPDFSRDRLVDEYNLVKQLDPNHTLIVSMSNNAIGTPIGDPTPDKWAISIYKRVWDKTVTKRYFEYPIPAWYYAFRAGWTELTRGRDSFIHELQAEAWVPDEYDIVNAPIEELHKSMDPDDLHHRFHYGEGTGMRKIDLWGAEWWYQMKVKRGQPQLWETAKAEYTRINNL